jgi:hypothetical protein
MYIIHGYFYDHSNHIECFFNFEIEEIVDRHVCRPYANAPDLPVLRPAELAANAIKGSVLHRCTLSPDLAVDNKARTFYPRLYSIRLQHGAVVVSNLRRRL